MIEMICTLTQEQIVLERSARLKFEPLPRQGDREKKEEKEGKEGKGEE